MMDEDAIESHLPKPEDEILFYGRPDYWKIMPLVLQIMPDIPWDFLAEFMPDKSYKTFQSWQTGKRAPKNPEGLIEATAAWARQSVSNSQDLSAQWLLKAYLADKKQPGAETRKMVGQVPDSILHHQLNLNSQTISRLRNGEDLRMETLKRLQNLLTDNRFPSPHKQRLRCCQWS